MSINVNPRSMPVHNQEANLIDVERALSELRAGRPVIITSAQGAALAQGVEGFDAGQAAQLLPLAGTRARLVLTGARLRRLGVDRPQGGALALPAIDPARIENLVHSQHLQQQNASWFYPACRD